MTSIYLNLCVLEARNQLHGLLKVRLKTIKIGFKELATEAWRYAIEALKSEP